MLIMSSSDELAGLDVWMAASGALGDVCWTQIDSVKRSVDSEKASLNSVAVGAGLSQSYSDRPRHQREGPTIRIFESQKMNGGGACFGDGIDHVDGLRETPVDLAREVLWILSRSHCVTR